MGKLVRVSKEVGGEGLQRLLSCWLGFLCVTVPAKSLSDHCLFSS